jgi:metal-responsive CopG/Arc/MetJ family transcriptional regulator
MTIQLSLPPMGPERKTSMVSVRLPAALVARVDYVARNIDSETVKNRSTAVHAALETWLPSQERRLEDLGILPKKAR